MTPQMFKIEVDGKPYLDPVKKFAVSKDLFLCALVTSNNQIIVSRVSQRILTFLTSSFCYSYSM